MKTKKTALGYRFIMNSNEYYITKCRTTKTWYISEHKMSTASFATDFKTKKDAVNFAKNLIAMNYSR